MYLHSQVNVSVVINSSSGQDSLNGDLQFAFFTHTERGGRERRRSRVREREREPAIFLKQRDILLIMCHSLSKCRKHILELILLPPSSSSSSSSSSTELLPRSKSSGSCDHILPTTGCISVNDYFKELVRKF